MKKIFLILILLLVFSGCSSSNKNEIEISFSESNYSVNQILNNSEILDENIYNPEVSSKEIESARGVLFEIPEDYEFALEKKYLDYKIMGFRQKDKKFKKGFTSFDQRTPGKPILIAVVKEDNIVVNLFALNYSVFDGSVGYEDYGKEKIKDAIEIKDLNNDDVDEILIHTFKGYSADVESALVTIYFDKEDNLFVLTNKIFSKTWKEAYEIIDINEKKYILETNSGSGGCRVCRTPYLVRIYQFVGNLYFDVGSVGVEKEYEEGVDAIKDALPRIKKK